MSALDDFAAEYGLTQSGPAAPAPQSAAGGALRVDSFEGASLDDISRALGTGAFAPQPVKEPEPMGRLRSARNAFVQGAAEIAADVPRGVAIGGTLLAEKTGLDKRIGTEGLRPEETRLYRAGEAVTEAAKEAFPTDPRYAGEFLTDTLPRAGGSFAGYAAGGAAALPLSPIVAPAVVAGGLGVASGASQMFKDAVDKGASLEDAYKSSGFGAALGSTEAIPIVKALDRLDAVTGGMAKRAVVRALKGATEEGLQETAQQLGQNLVANRIVGYDPNRDTTEGAGESAAAGGIIGGVFNFLLGLAGGRRARGGHADQPAASTTTESQPQPKTRPEGMPDVGAKVSADFGGGPGAAINATVVEYFDLPEGGQGVRLKLDTGEDISRSLDQVNLAELEEKAPLALPKPDTVYGEGFTMDESERETPQLALPKPTTTYGENFTMGGEAAGTPLERAVYGLNQLESGARVTNRMLADMTGSRDIDTLRQDLAAKGLIEKRGPAWVRSQVAEPTDGQKEAGNYRKRHMKWNGLDVSIETDKGQTRRGRGKDGQDWAVVMNFPYGYIKRTQGADGDQVDVTLGPNEQAPTVFVVNQVDPESGKFDEHKAFLGFDSQAEAERAYASSFSDGSGPDRMGGIAAMPVADFKRWARSGETAKPVETEGAVPVEETLPEAAPAAEEREATPEEKAALRAAARSQAARKAIETRKARKEALDLFEFIAARGGIRPDDANIGDVHTVLGRKQHMVPLYGAMIRRGGMSLDEAREAAEEAGYIGRGGKDVQATDLSDLLDAMDRQHRGNRVYSMRDIDVGQELERRKSDEQERDREAEALAMAKDISAEFAPWMDEADISEVAVQIRQGRDPMDARVTKAERRALAEMGDEVDNAADAADRQEVPPLDEPARTRGPGAAPEDEGGAGPRPAVREAGEDEVDRPDPGQDQQGEGPKALDRYSAPPAEEPAPKAGFSSERTDVGEQAVIPGAENVSDRQLAERRMEGRKQARVPQKPADEGLFDTGSRKQGALFAAPKDGAGGGDAAIDVSAEGVFKALRAELDRIGLKDIDLSVVEDILDESGKALGSGVYHPATKSIEVAMQSGAFHTLDHEAVHALRDIKLFTDAEWSALERAARSDKERMENIRSRYKTYGLSGEQMVEEAVADMYADWQAQKGQTAPGIRRLFQRVRQFFEVVGNALRGLGFTSADQVFQAIDKGKVGARERSGGGAGDRYAAPPAARAASRTVSQRFHAIKDRVSRIGDPFAQLPDAKQYQIARAVTQGRIGIINEKVRETYDLFAKAPAEVGKQIYAYLTTSGARPESISEAAYRAPAERVKRQIDVIGRALVSKGVIDQASYEKYRDAYLPRLYLKHVLEGDPASVGYGRKTSRQGYGQQRQDISAEVRALMGEIKDPAFLSAYGIAVPMRDLAILDFLDQVAGNKNWVWSGDVANWRGQRVSTLWLAEQANTTRKVAQYTKDPAEKQRLEAVARDMDRIVDERTAETGQIPDDYKRVPDTKRYGALRGIHVRKDIHDDIVGAFRVLGEDATLPEKLFGVGGIGTKVTQMWKMSKVSLNPPTQVRNFLTNFVLLHMSGVPLFRTPDLVIKAASEMAKGGKHAAIARKYGVGGGTFAANELFEINRELMDLRAREGGMLAKAMNIASIVARKAGDVYQLSDSLFKIAKIIDGMERKGLSEEQAVLEANKWLFDYSAVPRTVRYLRNAPIGMPFVTFTYKVMPRLLEAAIERPWVYAPYLGLGYALAQAVASSHDVEPEDVEKLKAGMAKWMRERGSVYALPWKDEKGRWQFIDMGYFFPWQPVQEAANHALSGDLTKFAGGSGILGGPITSIIVGLGSNKDPFTQRDIVNESDPPAKQVQDVLSWVWRLGAPTWVTDIGAAKHLLDAVTGTPNRKGDPPMTSVQALLRFGGINIYPSEPERMRAENLEQMKNEITKIKSRMSYRLKDQSLDKEDRDSIARVYSDMIREKAEAMRRFAGETAIHPNLATERRQAP